MTGGTVAFRRLQLPLSAKGQLYLHSMPGRREDWNQFEAAAADCKIQGIVCLADDAEIASKSPSYAKVLGEKFPYQLYSFPIPDFGVPTEESDFRAFIESVAKRVRDGDFLLAHCGAGIGRTGMFASCLLIALGCSTDEAHTAVKAAGSGPETDEQRQLVLRFASQRGD